MIGQTAAIFLDAYRELNAKKLFWIVLGLSVLFVAAFAGVGINERGLTLFSIEIPNDYLNTRMVPSKAYFYKTMFFTLGFQIWLTWIAVVLALVSTCGIIPDFLAGGAIELTLSKPIGRVRLLLTRIAAGTLFVVLQVTAFTLASFIVIGVRADAWVWSLFLAIPVVTLFFSYLYCVCAVIGVLTRSTIAALLLTLLFWFAIFIIHASETIFLQFHEMNRQAVLVLEGEVEMAQDALEEGEEPEEKEETRAELDELQSRLTDAEDDLALWNRIHAAGFAVKTILPKTTETMDLLGRMIIGDEAIAEQMERSEEMGAFGGQRVNGVYVSNHVVAQEIADRVGARSVFWIIGTSLLFEACVLAIGCVHFARRDY